MKLIPKKFCLKRCQNLGNSLIICDDCWIVIQGIQLPLILRVDLGIALENALHRQQLHPIVLTLIRELLEHVDNQLNGFWLHGHSAENYTSCLAAFLGLFSFLPCLKSSQ